MSGHVVYVATQGAVFSVVATIHPKTLNEGTTDEIEILFIFVCDSRGQPVGPDLSELIANVGLSAEFERLTLEAIAKEKEE